MPPDAYVLSKVAGHKIVILGENHWLRRDAELVTSLVPELRSRGAGLALEMLRAGDQEKIDQLLKLTERYCVVFQTLNTKPELGVEMRRG